MNKTNMKKTYTISIILIIVALILVLIGTLLFKSKGQDSNNQLPNNQQRTELSTDSLVVGNWVSVMAQKGSDGTYTAQMINICESESACSKTANPPSQQVPSGDVPNGAPTGQAPTGEAPQNQKNTANRSMLSGTITEVNSGSIVIDLDTGESATINISDSTKIVER